MKWQELIKTPEFYSHNATEQEMRKVVRQLSKVANKRLERLQAKGIQYSKGKETDLPDRISGVKRFSTKGKGVGQLIAEYKRVANFLNSPLSTIKGRQEHYYELKRRIAQKEHKTKPDRRETYREYAQNLGDREFFDEVAAIFQAMREGNWLSKAPKLQRQYDSSQLKEYFEEMVANNYTLSTEEIILRIKDEWGILEDVEYGFEDDVSTSQFM